MKTGTSSLMDGINSLNKIADEQLKYDVERLLDKDIFDQATLAMEEHYGYGCETEIDAYFRGAKWMQKNMYTEEQVREAMEFARGHSKMTDTQFIKQLKTK